MNTGQAAPYNKLIRKIIHHNRKQQKVSNLRQEAKPKLV